MDQTAINGTAKDPSRSLPRAVYARPSKNNKQQDGVDTMTTVHQYCNIWAVTLWPTGQNWCFFNYEHVLWVLTTFYETVQCPCTHVHYDLV